MHCRASFLAPVHQAQPLSLHPALCEQRQRSGLSAGAVQGKGPAERQPLMQLYDIVSIVQMGTFMRIVVAAVAQSLTGMEPSGARLSRQ